MVRANTHRSGAGLKVGFKNIISPASAMGRKLIDEGFRVE